MSETQQTIVLLATGFGLIVAGLLLGTTEAQVGLPTLGAALIVLAVILSRAEGELKLGPTGLEANLRAVKEEIVEKTEELDASLSAEGIDLEALARGDQPLRTVSAAARPAIERRIEGLRAALERIDRDQAALDVTPSALLEAGRGLIALGDWAQAADYFDRYTAHVPDDWDAQYARAVAHANARGGPEQDRKALRAYNDALVYRPPDLPANLLARLLSYRGAMLKRLGRLGEAEADLNAAAELATETYEQGDVAYNLACVYAMTGRREEALRQIRSLRSTPFIAGVISHLHDYFASMAHDAELLRLLGIEDPDPAGA